MVPLSLTGFLFSFDTDTCVVVLYRKFPRIAVVFWHALAMARLW